MTPKEQAIELVYKYYPQVQFKLGQEDCLIRAKECAKIAVDLVLSAYLKNQEEKEYWIEVEYWIDRYDN